jgi:hypothetical protein
MYVVGAETHVCLLSVRRKKVSKAWARDDKKQTADSKHRTLILL